MSVEELAAAVQTVLEGLPVGPLAEAQARLEAARKTLAGALAGSNQVDVQQCLDLLDEAQRTLVSITGKIQQVRITLESYLAGVVGGPTAPMPSSAARMRSPRRWPG